jgi:hypothetical protein
LKRLLAFGPFSLLAAAKSEEADRMADAKTKELNFIVVGGK